MTSIIDVVTGRERSILRAVSAGRVEIICGSEPDLVIDGLYCSDQYTAHRMTRLGLVRPAVSAGVGERVPAELTDSGRSALKPVTEAKDE